MKHTEGNWETQGTVVFSNNKLVANCVSDGIHFTDEDKANVRLIAAAPDLLEALIEAKNRFMDYRREDLTEQSLLVLEKTINAIKKATE